MKTAEEQREYRRKRNKLWREAHPNYMKEYQAANAEKYKGYSKTYITKNKDKVCRGRVEWGRNNPQALLEHQQRVKARRKQAFVEAVVRVDIYERDDGVCQICMLPCSAEDFSLDHIIPLARGGTHEPNNVQTAHRICNARKGTRIDN